jgi:inhibitor of Bruton tyrosine kinase
METFISPPCTSKAAVRRPSLGNSVKDLCLPSKQGSIAEVESALALLKKSGGNIVVEMHLDLVLSTLQLGEIIYLL